MNGTCTLFNFYSAKASHQPVAGLCCKMRALIDDCLRNTSTANKVSGQTEFTISDFTTDTTKPKKIKNKHNIIPKWKGLEAKRISHKKIQIVTILNMGIEFVDNKIIGKERFRWIPENES